MKKHFVILLTVILVCMVSSGILYQRWASQLKNMNSTCQIMRGNTEDIAGLKINTVLASEDGTLVWNVMNTMGTDMETDFRITLPAKKKVELPYSRFARTDKFPVYDGVINAGRDRGMQDLFVETALRKDDYLRLFTFYEMYANEGDTEYSSYIETCLTSTLTLSTDMEVGRGTYRMTPYAMEGYGFLQVNNKPAAEEEATTWLFQVTDQTGRFYDCPVLVLKRDIAYFDTFSFLNHQMFLTYEKDGKGYLEILRREQEPEVMELQEVLHSKIWEDAQGTLLAGQQEAILVDVSDEKGIRLIRFDLTDSLYGDTKKTPVVSVKRSEQGAAVLFTKGEWGTLDYRLIVYSWDGECLFDAWYRLDTPAVHEVVREKHEIIW